LEQQLAFVRALPASCAVFSGSATLIMPGVLWGLAGSIHPLTVAIPELLVNLWDATTTGKLEEAMELQRRVIEFTAVIGDLQRTAGRSVLRESLKLRDLPVVDFPRWPTKDLNSEQATRLKNALAVARD
ncbi:MAG: dihydrodipicolinate synthase family protein, partial [Deltaproteobacteria bacterium]|nr:dihydrodipicolinate synthase family protein [Deltaproteobacteria bacterium]